MQFYPCTPNLVNWSRVQCTIFVAHILFQFLKATWAQHKWSQYIMVLEITNTTNAIFKVQYNNICLLNIFLLKFRFAETLAIKYKC